MKVFFRQHHSSFTTLLKPLPSHNFRLPIDCVFILLPGGYRGDQVSNVLGQVAVVFRAMMRDSLLYELSLVR